MNAKTSTYDPPGEVRPGLKSGLRVVGILTILLGAAAVLFPFVAVLAAELVFGAVLAALGLVHVVRAPFVDGVESTLWTFVFGLLSLVTGGAMLFFPLQGAVALTAVVAAFFLAGGVAKLIAAWYVTPRYRRSAGLPEFRGWPWLAVSGGVSVLLGAILVLGMPAAAMWMVGLLIGIDLIFLGVSEIAFASALASADRV